MLPSTSEAVYLLCIHSPIGHPFSLRASILLRTFHSSSSFLLYRSDDDDAFNYNKYNTLYFPSLAFISFSLSLHFPPHLHPCLEPFKFYDPSIPLLPPPHPPTHPFVRCHRASIIHHQPTYYQQATFARSPPSSRPLCATTQLAYASYILFFLASLTLLSHSRTRPEPERDSTLARKTRH